MTADTFEELASSLGEAEFDLMLVGDGSGNKASDPSGWACSAYYRPSGRIRHYFGGTSAGTNNFAELMPYCHALLAFHAAWLEKHSSSPPSLRVLIVSDSEVTVRCGSGQYSRKANLSLWASINWFATEGYRITWRHIPRNTNAISREADRVAGEIRQEMGARKRG